MTLKTQEIFKKYANFETKIPKNQRNHIFSQEDLTQIVENH